MANTYTQLFIHIVFTVKGRENLISSSHRTVLEKYMTATLQNDGHKLLAIYCMPDHVHFFVGLNPGISISDMVQDVKRASTNFINQQKFVTGHFNWQKGYGAFSYAKSQVGNVVNYILTQEVHHRSRSFKEEYIQLLQRFEIEYDPKYLFEFYE